MTVARTVALLCALPLVSALFGGCFTGVESTPRIDTSDVKRKGADGTKAEQLFLSDVTPQAPSEWKRGKRFRVTDSRIKRIFSPQSSPTDNLPGQDIIFEEMNAARTLTGDDATELTFGTPDGRHFYYRVSSLDSIKVDTIPSLEIPFAIDLDIVEEIDRRLRGRNLFITTPAWYTPDGSDFKAINGLRHIEVKVDSVGCGNVNFPAAVYFSIADPRLASRIKDKPNAVLMSIGSSRASTRNFETLFAFDNPRKLHPLIRDDAWELIIASQIRAGMTREECRLALGAPTEVIRIPTYAGMSERWSYSDGIFLIFEDGFLSQFRK